MPLTAGSKLGPYEILAPIGAGGMGEVWRARDSRLGREVALKVLPDQVSREPERIARFRTEARSASALNHAHIVTIYDVGEDRGTWYLSMELLQGVTVRQLLVTERPPLRKALELAAQIADGLAAAHAKGIVHRDLKPENLIVTDEGVLKILDFGLAKLAAPMLRGDDESTLSLGGTTEPGTLLGTVGYMSPEQAAGAAVDFRSDQFSFGTILYELVSGRMAWKRPTPAESIVAILREEPPPLSTAGDPVPAAVCRVITRCLAKNPAERYGSTRDLAHDVKELAGASAWGPAPAPDVAVETRSPPARRRVSARTAAALLAVAAAAAAGAMFLGKTRAAPQSIASLAVLPFENASRDPDAEYLSDGITESLIDRMSNISALKVMARATVFRFKGATDPLDAGRKLGVEAVVTGRVSRRNGRLSIGAELVEVASGARLWGDTYDRDAADLVRVQDAIAGDISTGLRLRLTDPQKRVLARHGTENPEAYELYLKGRHAFYTSTEDGYLEAIRLFRQAFEKDPSFAEAYSWSANAWGSMAVDGYSPPKESFDRLAEGAQKALALDPQLSAARFALGSRRLFIDWDFDGAERDLRDVLRQGEATFVDYRPLALLLWARGRVDQALEVMRTARRADPGNIAYGAATADYLRAAGKLEESAAQYRTVIELDPSDPRAYFGLAEALRRQGQIAAAIDSLRKAYELTGESSGRTALEAARTDADYASAQARVAKARLDDLAALAKTRYVSPLELARLAAECGERETAFRYLDGALAERSAGLVLLKADDAWDSIRADPRFAALVSRIGIP